MTLEAHTHTQMMTSAQRGSGAERELKFVADRKTLKAALALPLLGGVAEAPKWLRLKSVYFDTQDADLMLHSVTLRVRRTKAGYIMGLKREPPDAKLKAVRIRFHFVKKVANHFWKSTI
jgi:hypothetical protein